MSKEFFIATIYLLILIDEIGYSQCYKWSWYLGIWKKKHRIDDVNIANIQQNKKIKLENCTIRKTSGNSLVFRPADKTILWNYFHKVYIKHDEGEFYLMMNYPISYLLLALLAISYFVIVNIITMSGIERIAFILFIGAIPFVSAVILEYSMRKYAKKKEKDFLSNSIKEITAFSKAV